MRDTIVTIKGLSHRYTREWAIRDISFEIPAIGVVGLLGSNGAGKSTTMNILCGVLAQTEGEVWIDGILMRDDPAAAKRNIGFLPQNAPLYLELTVIEYLRYCAVLRDIPTDKISEAVENVMQKCGVKHFENRVLRHLSGGYRQRVGIAQAIIHRPKLVVLDEPTNGLDPNQILEVRRLILEIAEERAVIFSSHILSEVQAICDDIKMIESGRLVFEDSMYAFNNYILPDSLVMRLEKHIDLAEIQQIPHIKEVEYLLDGSIRVRFLPDEDIAKQLVIKSVEQQWGLSEISLERSSLDEIFAQLSNKKSIKK